MGIQRKRNVYYIGVDTHRCFDFWLRLPDSDEDFKVLSSFKWDAVVDAAHKELAKPFSC